MKSIIKFAAALVALSALSLQLSVTALPLSENSHEREGEITHIVLHFTSNVIANPENPFVMEEVYETFRESEAGVHYFIERDGTVHSAVPEERAAWHAGRGNLEAFPQYKDRLNHHSIGIELLGIGSFNDMRQYISQEEYNALNPEFIGFTDAQYVSLNKLVNNILNRYPTIKPNRNHVIGHSEYSSNNKTDPGELFDWSRLELIKRTK
jgi:N-acetyl-anhydromuramyl-L-alanine amidase AmpD